jgi:hypothetical protein
MSRFYAAIKEILTNYGHDIILQRRNPNNRGYSDVFERHTVRHTFPSVRGLPQIQQERPEGITHAVDMVYYFLLEAEPREMDRIYEYDPRYKDVIFSSENSGELQGYAQSVWTIDYSMPMRAENGEIVFWTVGVTRDTPT